MIEKLRQERAKILAGIESSEALRKGEEDFDGFVENKDREQPASDNFFVASTAKKRKNKDEKSVSLIKKRGKIRE